MDLDFPRFAPRPARLAVALGPRTGLAWRPVRQPLYMHLAHQLRDGLHQGRWAAREALPSERELAELLAVSRDTARKAMDLLCQRGLLVRVQGSGTYAKGPALRGAPAPLTAGTDDARPGVAAAQQLVQRRRRADALERQVFALGPGAEVWQRLSMVNPAHAAPALCSLIWPAMPGARDGRASAPPAPDLAATELRLLRVEARAADALLVHFLGLRSGEAVLRLSHVALGAEGQVLALQHKDSRGMEVGLSLETRWRPPGGSDLTGADRRA